MWRFGKKGSDNNMSTDAAPKQEEQPAQTARGLFGGLTTKLGMGSAAQPNVNSPSALVNPDPRVPTDSISVTDTRAMFNEITGEIIANDPHKTHESAFGFIAPGDDANEPQRKDSVASSQGGPAFSFMSDNASASVRKDSIESNSGPAFSFMQSGAGDASRKDSVTSNSGPAFSFMSEANTGEATRKDSVTSNSGPAFSFMTEDTSGGAIRKDSVTSNSGPAFSFMTDDGRDRSNSTSSQPRKQSNASNSGGLFSFMTAPATHTSSSPPPQLDSADRAGTPTGTNLSMTTAATVEMTRASSSDGTTAEDFVPAPRAGAVAKKGRMTAPAQQRKKKLTGFRPGQGDPNATSTPATTATSTTPPPSSTPSPPSSPVQPVKRFSPPPTMTTTVPSPTNVSTTIQATASSVASTVAALHSLPQDTTPSKQPEEPARLPLSSSAATPPSSGEPQGQSDVPDAAITVPEHQPSQQNSAPQQTTADPSIGSSPQAPAKVQIRHGGNSAFSPHRSVVVPPKAIDTSHADASDEDNNHRQPHHQARAPSPVVSTSSEGEGNHRGLLHVITRDPTPSPASSPPMQKHAAPEPAAQLQQQQQPQQLPQVEQHVPPAIVEDTTPQGQLTRVLQKRKATNALLVAALAKRPGLLETISTARQKLAKCEADQLAASEREDFDLAASLDVTVQAAKDQLQSSEDAMAQHEAEIERHETTLRDIAAAEVVARKQVVAALHEQQTKLTASLEATKAQHNAETTQRQEELQAEEERVSTDRMSCTAEQDALQKELDVLQAKINEHTHPITSEVESLKSQKAVVETEIERLLAELEKQRAESSRLSDAIATAEGRITKETKKFAPQQRVLERRKQANAETWQQCHNDEAALAGAKEAWENMCKEMKQQLKHLEDQIVENKALITSAERDLESATQREQISTVVVEDARQTQQALTTATKNLNEATHALSLVETEVAELHHACVSARAGLDALRGKVSSIAQQETRANEEKAAAVKAKNFKEAARLQAELKAMKDDADAAQQEIAQLESIVQINEHKLQEQATKETALKQEVETATTQLHRCRFAHLVSSHKRLRVHMQSALATEDFEGAAVVQADMDALGQELTNLCQELGWEMPDLGGDENNCHSDEEANDDGQPTNAPPSDDIVDANQHAAATVEAAPVAHDATNDSTHDAVVEAQPTDANAHEEPTLADTAPTAEDTTNAEVDAEQLKQDIADIETRLNEAVELENYSLADELNMQLEAKQKALAALESS